MQVFRTVVIAGVIAATGAISRDVATAATPQALASRSRQLATSPVPAEMTGRFGIRPDGSLFGTLPPGTTKETPPEVPGDPSIAARIRNAPAALALELHEAPPTVPGKSIDTAALEASGAKAKALDQRPDDGCAHARSNANVQVVEFWGYATQCSRGDLIVRIWGSGTVTGDTSTTRKTCNGSTGCSLEGQSDYFPGSRYNQTFTNYFDVQNRTTGGYSIAWQRHAMQGF